MWAGTINCESIWLALGLGKQPKTSMVSGKALVKILPMGKNSRWEFECPHHQYGITPPVVHLGLPRYLCPGGFVSTGSQHQASSTRHPSALLGQRGHLLLLLLYSDQH